MQEHQRHFRPQLRSFDNLSVDGISGLELGRLSPMIKQARIIEISIMAEPFKNLFNPTMIAQMGGHIGRACSDFNVDAFIASAVEGLEDLELKQRSNQICESLEQHLPADYRKACTALVDALHPTTDWSISDIAMDDTGIASWAIMPMGEFVARRGIDDFDFSMDILGEFTKRFSAEFAIRAFFIADQTRALSKAMEWASSDNFHLRRLASEGSRPRLPWGLQLTEFVNDPKPLIPLLEQLKDDDEEYVRRSVANNLNDIAKDHPDLIAQIASDWMVDATKDRQRMVKHACRSLIKSGHKPTLKALGYGKPAIEFERLAIKTPQVTLGETLEFDIALTSTASETQPLIIDFIVHHRKANGDLSPKTFKWKIIDLSAGKRFESSKKHPMKPITTRTYYAGTHRLEIQINGVTFHNAEFDLTL